MGPSPSQVCDLQAAQLPAEQAPQPPKFTPKQIGQLRRRFVTVVHSHVNACGHSFHPTNEPRTNCDDCWEAYFRVQTGVVKGIESILKVFGEAELVKARGTKFVKRYKTFAAMVEEEQRNAAAQEINGTRPDTASSQEAG